MDNEKSFREQLQETQKEYERIGRHLQEMKKKALVDNRKKLWTMLQSSKIENDDVELMVDKLQSIIGEDETRKLLEAAERKRLKRAEKTTTYNAIGDRPTNAGDDNVMDQFGTSSIGTTPGN